MAITLQRSDQRSEQRPRQRLQIRTPGNRFDIDQSRIPQGMAYEWKRKNFMGAEDIEHLVNLDANGWTAVPAERHPELSGTRLQSGSEIVRGGLMLMERPVEITEEARELDGFAAKNAVASQVQRLGLSARTVKGGIKRSYAPPPEDAMVAEDE
jgi:hypothetical protein